MQELAEFLAKDTRVNLALTTQLHDREVLLTPGGFLMLAIPLLEGARLQETSGGQSAAPAVARDSIGRLLDSMKSEPASADTNIGKDTRRIVIGRKSSLLRPRAKPVELGPRENLRSSFSVIRAYWQRYCTIPPFCEKS